MTAVPVLATDWFGPLLAQAPTAPKSYFMESSVVVLLAAAALYAICRSSRRI